jgi:SAM-dependent methyltransferase
VGEDNTVTADETPPWHLQELLHAGPEHLDPAYVAAYEEKSPTDWTDDLAKLSALGVGAKSTVVDLGAGTGAMVEAMRRQGIEAVHAGFLTYEHEGDPPAAVFSRNALHHLPDFWKAIALERVAGLLRPGGAFLLRDLVYSFDPRDADDAIARWLAAAPTDAATGWTAEQLAEHVREEHSTFTWLLEPMLEHAGFEIHERWLSPEGAYASYTCLLAERK